MKKACSGRTPSSPAHHPRALVRSAYSLSTGCAAQVDLLARCERFSNRDVRVRICASSWKLKWAGLGRSALQLAHPMHGGLLGVQRNIMAEFPEACIAGGVVTRGGARAEAH